MQYRQDIMRCALAVDEGKLVESADGIVLGQWLGILMVMHQVGIFQADRNRTSPFLTSSQFAPRIFYFLDLL